MPSSLAEHIAERAARMPDALGYATTSEQMSWAEYEARSMAGARHSRNQGLQRGDRVGVLVEFKNGTHLYTL